MVIWSPYFRGFVWVFSFVICCNWAYNNTVLNSILTRYTVVGNYLKKQENISPFQNSFNFTYKSNGDVKKKLENDMIQQTNVCLSLRFSLVSSTFLAIKFMYFGHAAQNNNKEIHNSKFWLNDCLIYWIGFYVVPAYPNFLSSTPAKNHTKGDSPLDKNLFFSWFN